MKSSPLVKILLVSILHVSVYQTDAALSTVQNFSLLGGSDGRTGGFPGPQFVANAGRENPVFSKFDSTLGTLTEIRFTAQIDATSSIRLDVSRVTNASQPFTALFNPATSSMFADVALIYLAGGGSVGSITLSEVATLSQIGITNGDPDNYSEDSGSFEISYSDQTSSSFGGFSAGGGMSLTTGSIFTTDSGFMASDFVGAGNVNGLSFLGLLQIDFLTGTLANVANATITPEISYRPGNLTLQYVFEPIPEPSFVMLLSLCGLLGFRRSR